MTLGHTPHSVAYQALGAWHADSILFTAHIILTEQAQADRSRPGRSIAAMDGTEFEVTDLRTGATRPHALAESARRPRGALRILQGQSRRAFLTLCTALLAFLLLARAGASPDLLGLLFHRPPPLPGARLGVLADTLSFAHAVPAWGLS